MVGAVTAGVLGGVGAGGVGGVGAGGVGVGGVGELGGVGEPGGVGVLRGVAGRATLLVAADDVLEEPDSSPPHAVSRVAMNRCAIQASDFFLLLF